jgi:phosphoesterase RecJ-like protein
MKRKPFTVQLQEAARFIQENDRFLVVSHINPDGDAVGSTCAIGSLLKKLNKSFVLLNDGHVPGKFHIVPMSDEIVDFSKEGVKEPFRHIIAVDAADIERIGDVLVHLAEDYQLLNIDHHPTNNGYGQYTLIRDDAAATAEIIFELALAMDVYMDKELCTCLYTGLMTDTGGFRYSNTTPQVMRIASRLLEAEVEASILAERLLETISLGQVRLLQRSLKTLSFAAEGKVGWMTISMKDFEGLDVDSSDTDGIMVYPRNIEGVEVGLLFKEVDSGRVKVSFRSKNIDVAAIAQAFDGGGHVKASGCTLLGTLQEAQDQVIQKVLEALETQGGN